MGSNPRQVWGWVWETRACAEKKKRKKVTVVFTHCAAKETHKDLPVTLSVLGFIRPLRRTNHLSRIKWLLFFFSFCFPLFFISDFPSQSDWTQQEKGWHGQMDEKMLHKGGGDWKTYCVRKARDEQRSEKYEINIPPVLACWGITVGEIINPCCSQSLQDYAQHSNLIYPPNICLERQKHMRARPTRTAFICPPPTTKKNKKNTIINSNMSL